MYQCYFIFYEWSIAAEQNSRTKQDVLCYCLFELTIQQTTIIKNFDLIMFGLYNWYIIEILTKIIKFGFCVKPR